MATSNLAPGDHTVVYTKDGYSDLTITFNVSTTGAVACKTVSGGVCNRTVPPGCMVSGRTLTGYIKMADIYDVKIVSTTTDKNVYEHGEEILLALSVRNAGNVATVWCYKLRFGSFSDADCTNSIAAGQTDLYEIGIPVSSSLTPGDYTITVEAHPQGHPVTDMKTISITIGSATYAITFASVPAGATIRVDGNLI